MKRNYIVEIDSQYGHASVWSAGSAREAVADHLREHPGHGPLRPEWTALERALESICAETTVVRGVGPRRARELVEAMESVCAETTPACASPHPDLPPSIRGQSALYARIRRDFGMDNDA